MMVLWKMPKQSKQSKQSLYSNNEDSYFNKLKNNFKIRSKSVASVTKRNNKNSLCSREEKHAVNNVKLRKFTWIHVILRNFT